MTILFDQSSTDASPAIDAFNESVMPILEKHEVVVDGLYFAADVSELHVRLYLPNHTRYTRETVVTALADYQDSFNLDVMVVPSILHSEDLPTVQD